MNKCTKILMVCLTLLLVAFAQPALGSNWPQFQKDKIHSGVTGDSAPIAPNNTAISWTNDTVPIPFSMAGIDVSPIVCNGFVYAVTTDGKLTKHHLDGTPAGDPWPVSFVANPGPYEFQLATPVACPCGYIFVLDT
jgi:PKD repeat protein